MVYERDNNNYNNNNNKNNNDHNYNDNNNNDIDNYENIIGNNTNKIEVERQQHELLQYLRKAVNNFSITLKITVNETLEKKYAYTPKDKYEKLAEKNKNIELLRKTFDLDL